MIRFALPLVALLLTGCQTDLALVDLKAKYGGPPSRFLPMDGIEVHWRDEGPGGVARTDASPTGAPMAAGAGGASSPSTPAPAASAPSGTAPASPAAAPPSPAFASAPAGGSAFSSEPAAPAAGSASSATAPTPAPAPAPTSATAAAPPSRPAPLRGGAEPPTLLLLHGTASSLHTWDGWAARLSRDFRVVRLDLPGFGLTGPHPSGDYSAAATIDFLERFAAAAGLARFAIVGNSLGGYYAWRYALRHPEQVSAMVLIDAAGYPVPTSQTTAVALQVARMPVISELIRWVPIGGAVRRSLLDVYVDDTKVTPELVDRYTDLMRRPGNRAAFGDRARAGPHAEGFRRLPELRVPTLILWGEQDRWIPVSNAERFRADIPGSRLIRYPDLGHLPMEEDPERTARDVAAFLRGVAAGAPAQK